MEKILLEELINKNMSLHKISVLADLSYSTVRYWVKKYNLKTNFSRPDVEPGKKICSRCKIKHNIDIFYKKGKNKIQTYCKSCHNKIFTQRWIDRKIWSIQYKGSKCCDCNISYPETPYAVFDFHHLDPVHKDMDWSKIRLVSKDRMKAELDKCVLLCANCHRIRHFKELLWSRMDSNHRPTA